MNIKTNFNFTYIEASSVSGSFPPSWYLYSHVQRTNLISEVSLAGNKHGWSTRGKQYKKMRRRPTSIQETKSYHFVLTICFANFIIHMSHNIKSRREARRKPTYIHQELSLFFFSITVYLAYGIIRKCQIGDAYFFQVKMFIDGPEPMWSWCLLRPPKRNDEIGEKSGQ